MKLLYIILSLLSAVFTAGFLGAVGASLVESIGVRFGILPNPELAIVSIVFIAGPAVGILIISPFLFLILMKKRYSSLILRISAAFVFIFSMIVTTWLFLHGKTLPYVYSHEELVKYWGSQADRFWLAPYITDLQVSLTALILLTTFTIAFWLSVLPTRSSSNFPDRF